MGKILVNRHEGKKYAITGSEALSNYDIARKLTTALARKASYYNVTAKQAEESMAKTCVPRWMIESLLELIAIRKAGHAADVSPAIGQIHKQKPISFDQFLAESREAFRANNEVAGVA
jgi:uncharacterized protein YbjT (DUF2867 family)